MRISTYHLSISTYHTKNKLNIIDNYNDLTIAQLLYDYNDLTISHQSIIISEMDTSPTQQQLPQSSYKTQNNSLLQQAMAYIPGKFPQPTLILQSNLNYIPHYLMNADLYKQIHTFNKNLVFDLFQDMADFVIQFWMSLSTQFNNIDYRQFLSRLCEKMTQSQYQGNYYAGRLMQNAETILKSTNAVQLIKNILHCVGYSNLQYYGLTKQPQQQSPSYLQIKLPQKYEAEIDLKLNMISKPAQNNYFEQLILNQMNQSQPNRKTQQQVEAQATADLLTDFFNFRRNGDALQNKKSLRKADSIVNFFPFVVTRGQKVVKQKENQPQSQPQKLSTQHQNLLNQLILSIQSQRIGQQKPQKPLLLKQKSLQIQNWLTNTFSQMTYYESYMMAHMADLIFRNTAKFDARLIKYEPYWHSLQKQLVEQINCIKNEDTSYRISMESNKKYDMNSWPTNNKNEPHKSKQKQSKNKSVGQKLLNKAKGKITQLYNKAKQQLKKPITEHQSYSNSQNYLQSNKYYPINTAIYSNFKDSVIQLQNIKMYINKIVDLQIHRHSSSNPVIDSLRTFADEIKNKVFKDDTPYYYEIQSWMAIVMVLFKELTMNPAANYHYSPYKRRLMIRILKRLFIYENNVRENLNHLTKPMQQSQLKNWPIVLKYLQNNRQQVVSTPPITEKQTQRIIQQIYTFINEKRLLGSTFGNLFEGIQKVKDNLPFIKFVCLSNATGPTNIKNKGNNIQHGMQQCKVVHILVSGFLSEDTDKFQQWADMIDTMPDSEIYAIVWESSTIKNLVKFFLKSAADIIGAIKMIDELHRKYTDNPFNPAFQVAQLTGRILAQLVMRIFPNKFINICGYSLGSQVIKQFIKRLIDKNSQHLLNNIYIMGGVSDNQSIAHILSRSKVSLSLYNCYTNNDLVLKHLLSKCKPENRPVGLFEIRPVDGHYVSNIDCSKFISGHLAFRSNMKLMGEILELSIG